MFGVFRVELKVEEEFVVRVWCMVRGGGGVVEEGLFVGRVKKWCKLFIGVSSLG